MNSLHYSSQAQEKEKPDQSLRALAPGTQSVWRSLVANLFGSQLVPSKYNTESSHFVKWDLIFTVILFQACGNSEQILQIM